MRLDGAKGRPGANTTATDRAASVLRTGILRGEYRTGAALPPERALAEQLGVSRLTLRAAIAKLQSEGLVHPVHGSGTVVLDLRRCGGLELLGPLLSLALSGGSSPLSLLRELLELRIALAVETLGLAGARATADDRAALEAQLSTLRDAAGEPERFMLEDLAFARLWVRAAKNLPLELLYNSIERALRAQSGAVVLFIAPQPDATVAVYQKLLALLGRGEPERLRKLARRLLALHDARLLRALSALQAATTATSDGAVRS